MFADWPINAKFYTRKPISHVHIETVDPLPRRNTIHVTMVNNIASRFSRLRYTSSKHNSAVVKRIEHKYNDHLEKVVSSYNNV